MARAVSTPWSRSPRTTSRRSSPWRDILRRARASALHDGIDVTLRVGDRLYRRLEVGQIGTIRGEGVCAELVRESVHALAVTSRQVELVALGRQPRR